MTLLSTTIFGKARDEHFQFAGMGFGVYCRCGKVTFEPRKDFTVQATPISFGALPQLAARIPGNVLQSESHIA